MKDLNGKLRVVIENVSPSIEGGLFPARRVQGETVIVEADIFADGHDCVAARLLVSREKGGVWEEFPMRHLGNDRWRGMFIVSDLGSCFFTVNAGIDRFATLAMDFSKKFEVDEATDVDVSPISGEISSAATRAGGKDAESLEGFLERISRASDLRAVSDILTEKPLGLLMAKHADRADFITWPNAALEVVVERGKARFSTWYEFFPRSTCSGGMGGTLKEACGRLPEIARMGFDVVYLPPIHPIGRTDRKGPNNTLPAGPSDPGSPWAIGSDLGGHKSVDPGLGTIKDLQSFIKKANVLGLEVALDIAFQCSPDHPYIRQHPEWFRHRPDGSIQYAENPPKKYQDIVPFNFENDNWVELWEELKSIVLFWIGHGVSIFRVDNPHTKPMPFWQWLIGGIREEHPEVIFLSEAFTRPKVMRRLARSGFAQSYTYFTWRNTKQELMEYMRELTGTELGEYFQPHFWPNTPDILPEFLQIGGLPAFRIRLVLAATLSSSYGIYGPAFELGVHNPLPGREEYLGSEKFEVHDWNWDQQGNLRDLIVRVNRIRRENPALQTTRNIRFLETDNDNILFFSKESADGENLIVAGITHDPFSYQECSVTLPLEELGIDPDHPYLMHDLLGDEKFIWQGSRNKMGFDPNVLPARIFSVRRRMRHEQDFDYFL